MKNFTGNDDNIVDILKEKEDTKSGTILFNLENSGKSNTICMDKQHKDKMDLIRLTHKNKIELERVKGEEKAKELRIKGEFEIEKAKELRIKGECELEKAKELRIKGECELEKAKIELQRSEMEHKNKIEDNAKLMMLQEGNKLNPENSKIDIPSSNKKEDSVENHKISEKRCTKRRSTKLVVLFACVFVSFALFFLSIRKEQKEPDDRVYLELLYCLIGGLFPIAVKSLF